MSPQPQHRADTLQCDDCGCASVLRRYLLCDNCAEGIPTPVAHAGAETERLVQAARAVALRLEREDDPAWDTPSELDSLSAALARLADEDTPQPRMCHCGSPATRQEQPDPWEGRMDGYCDECATSRCDVFSPCPVEIRTDFDADNVRLREALREIAAIEDPTPPVIGRIARAALAGGQADKEPK